MPVNAKQFTTLLNKGNDLQEEDFQALVRLHETFPYFVLPKILAAKYEKKHTAINSTDHLHWASVQSPDRSRLKQLVEQDIDFLPASLSSVNRPMIAEETPALPSPPDRPEPAREESLSSQQAREEILKRLEENLHRFKNSVKKPAEADQSTEPIHDTLAEDLIATIRKKEKKAILDARKKEQNDLIKAFSKKSTQLATIQEIQNTANVADLSKSSTAFNDKIITESFARLLVKQNNKNQAIEIYRKLILKFPDKSAYLAALIKELED